MPFELKAPDGLWLLGLLAPLIVLYVLKIRRERRVVPSTWLWRTAARDLRAQSPLRRLVPEVPLALELLALVLLAIGLARPATRGGHLSGEHVALVIDTSASMGALDSERQSRMTQARAAARSVIRALAPGAEAVVIAAGRDARIVSAMDRDRGRLQSSIERLEATETEGQLGLALAAASAALRAYSGRVRIVVISDGAPDDRDALARVSLPVELIQVGSPVENTAIVRFFVTRAQNPETRRTEVQAFALVAHFGGRPRSVYATLRQRNVTEPLASRRLDLAPGERAPVVLSFEPSPSDAGSGLLVELSPHDALAADDRAFGRVPPSQELPVVLAPANGSPWVARALQADPDVELLGVSLEGLSSAGVPDDALVVVDGACPAQTPGADLLVLNPPQGGCRTARVGDTIRHPTLTSWTEIDPRLRFLSFDGVDVAKAQRLEPDSSQASLLRSNEGCLIADVSTPGRTATLLGFDVGESNWPLKASFVLFMRNVVELARSHRDHGLDAPARTGEPLSVRVPYDTQEVQVEDPAGRQFKRPARGGLLVLPDLPRAGFYFANWHGARPGSALFAANLTSERESDLQQTPLAGPRGQPLRAHSVREAIDSVTEWSWLLSALALALIAFDLYWVTRRPRSRPLSGTPPRPERAARARA